jgi:hypothetical protein
LALAAANVKWVVENIVEHIRNSVPITNIPENQIDTLAKRVYLWKCQAQVFTKFRNQRYSSRDSDIPRVPSNKDEPKGGLTS